MTWSILLTRMTASSLSTKRELSSCRRSEPAGDSRETVGGEQNSRTLAAPILVPLHQRRVGVQRGGVDQGFKRGANSGA